jgi:hypothetical protein
MFMAEWNGLFFDDFNVGDVGPAVHRIRERQQQTRAQCGGADADIGKSVCAAVEKLRHPD